MDTAIVDFTTYSESIKKALDAVNACETLEKQTAILLKPNLMGPQPFPVTTSIECCDAVLDYVRACAPKADIVVGDGCGDPDMDISDLPSSMPRQFGSALWLGIKVGQIPP